MIVLIFTCITLSLSLLGGIVWYIKYVLQTIFEHQKYAQAIKEYDLIKIAYYQDMMTKRGIDHVV
jgi:hypothetical protein